MKKGFTLIELLAVIVILAVIALIVTPVIGSLIDNARLSSALRSVEGYVSGANGIAAVSLVDTDGILLTDEKHIYETGEDDLELKKIKTQGKAPNYVYLQYDLATTSVSYGRFCQNGYSIDYVNGVAKKSNSDYCSDIKVIVYDAATTSYEGENTTCTTVACALDVLYDMYE